MNAANTTALSLRDPWSLVPSLGNLESYVSAVHRMPMLTPSEELELGRSLRDNGDLQSYWHRVRGKL